jgi:hypothetical protein
MVPNHDYFTRIEKDSWKLIMVPNYDYFTRDIKD